MGNQKSPMVSIIIVTCNRKELVIRCLDSVLKSEYPFFEVILVDNNSSDGTPEEIEKNFKDVKLLRNSENLMAAGGRNSGIKVAKGKFLLFIDSDNVVDREMVSHLSQVLQSNDRIGMVGPQMFFYSDPKRIWYSGADIDLLTGKTTYFGYGKIDDNSVKENREVGHIPNVFMIKKSVLDKVGYFDERYKIMYEEADMALRIKKIGFKILLVPDAITFHDVPMYSPGDDNNRILRSIGMESPERIILFTTNRYLYLSKFAIFYQKILFILIFQVFFLIYYIKMFMSVKRSDLIKFFITGVKNGNKLMLRSLLK